MICAYKFISLVGYHQHRLLDYNGFATHNLSHTSSRFINNTQVTVNHWLLHFGMSIGIADTVADEATMGSINAIIEKVSGNSWTLCC